MVKQIGDLKWKTVGVEGIPMGEDFSGFLGLEECTDYILNTKVKNVQEKSKKEPKKRKKDKPENQIKTKKIKLANGFIVETIKTIQPSISNASEKLAEKKNYSINKKTVTSSKIEDAALSMEGMEVWMQYQIPESILKALAEQGFKKPTKIQELTLAPAIMGRRDILGAAETGSGKTLAFGLPILCGILQLKEKEEAGINTQALQYKKSSAKRRSFDEKTKKDVNVDRGGYKDDCGHDNEDRGGDKSDESDNEENENGADDSSDADYVHLSDMLDDDDLAEVSDDDEQLTNDEGVDIDEYHGGGTDGGMGCVKVIDNIGMPKSNVVTRSSKPLYALILTPTRELAVQVGQHLRSAAKYTGIYVATIFGGMASVKQERILSKGPEIVVATPGRLWELVQAGYTSLDNVKFLAIDETDRMVERNHFDELKLILERMNGEEQLMRSRQNFVFSATLTMVHDLPTHMKGKKVTKGGKVLNRRVEKMTSQVKMQRLIDMIGMTDPKIVDITNKNQGTAETLTECMITCALEQKDVYLYYLLHRHPGRTIVFCNSIGSVKRLAQLLSILKLEPLPLHANMMQKQRLKNLEKFTSKERSILVATDVAARGLDIANVDHVIHYQVPRTAENYVHRSGRTARASKEGLTILMIEPGEAYHYQKLCRTFERTTDLPRFPVEPACLTSFTNAVKTARDLERILASNRKTNSEHGWYDKAAKEMDIVLDEDFVSIKKPQSDASTKQIQAKRKELDLILSRPLFPKGFSFRYPTLNNDSLLQSVRNEEDALTVMKEALASGKIKKDKRKTKNASLLQIEKEFSKQNGGLISQNGGGKKIKDGSKDGFKNRMIQKRNRRNKMRVNVKEKK